MDTADLNAPPSDFFPREIEIDSGSTIGGRALTRNNGERCA